MSKQKVPSVVSEILKEISQKVKNFSLESSIKLIAKSSDSFLVKIFPEGYEFLFFEISSYHSESINNSNKLYRILFEVVINKESYFEIDEQQKKYNFLSSDEEIPSQQFHGEKEFTLKSFQVYLNTLEILYPIAKDLEYIDLKISDYFELEETNLLISEPDFFVHSDNVLPYSLKQLFIKNFQGVKFTNIDNIPVDTQWIFLVGENGFGKTTILQSIFLGLNGTLDGNINLLESKESNIQVEYKSLEKSLINNSKNNKTPLQNLAAYGPGRLNLQSVKSDNAEDRNNSISYNLFNSDGFLFNINSELVRLGLKQDKRFNLIRNAICRLIPNLADIRLSKETDQIEYVEQEIDSDGKGGQSYLPLPFQKLASGFKSTIALAGDIIVRLSKNQLSIEDPSQLKGIVIIDEIDLHLHPKLQKQLVGNFSRVFPKIQFIVSTHSPIPLLGAPSNSIILKVNRNNEEGIQIERVKIDLKNLTPNLVLTSGIFDMEDFVSVQNQDITEVRTEDSFNEMEKNDAIEETLKAFEESNMKFPDELFKPASQQ